MESIKDKVAIIGMGCTTFGELWDKSPEDMIVEAAYEAYEDAGIDPGDIQAAWVGTLRSGEAGVLLADPLKLSNIPITRVENWCSTGHEALRAAAYAVAAGAYDVVLALGFEKLKDTGFGGLGVGRGTHPVYQARQTAPGYFSMLATRYFHHYGLSGEEGKRILAKISVKNHHNGAMHPKAHLRREVTEEQVMNAPIISWPLGLFDCCGVTDGAAAAIVCRADLAKNFRADPVYIKGIGASADAMLPMQRPGFDYLSVRATVESGKQAFEQAGIKNPRKELSLASVHDCFTITEMIIYEDLGFSPRGKAPEDVRAGTFTLEGELPINTDGGLKSFGHPIGATGLRTTYEIYKQLQGKCGPRQLKNVTRGLAHTLGGSPQVSNVLIFGNEPERKLHTVDKPTKIT
ncbi:MAG: acetyl-CoA acetyltransferase [Dehalococcoidia bacterium]|nr:acetyl-CoA acetyltransferase [Dehalococcoidia bacterium]